MVQQRLFQLCHVAGGRRDKREEFIFNKDNHVAEAQLFFLMHTDQFFIYAQRRTASGNSHHKVFTDFLFLANLVCYLLSDGKRTFIGRFVDVCRDLFQTGQN